MIDKVTAILVVVATAGAFCSSGLGVIIRIPNWWGVIMAIGTLSVGCMACASVIRDRL